ncbi:catalase [Enterobacter hormaechei]|uniref:Catalase n=1 Tax=Enterobacter hormaechei TaxID=158836 RepID=A0A4Y5ZP00_9ENTR|nr:catalase [Enterobacter hormaechei]
MQYNSTPVFFIRRNIAFNNFIHTVFRATDSIIQSAAFYRIYRNWMRLM